ncbi:MAG: hypothetical protein ACR2RD_15705, partial [Woeseiaceae bacterium]
MTRNILQSYYAATILFLVLDYVFGLNIRLAFLDESVALKIAYYGFCLACLALMIWRPAWTVIIGAFESLLTLIAIIMHMALRVMVITDQTIESGQGYVTMPEIINFILAG